MPLNPQFILAPPLMEYFVDRDTGFPLAGGVITFYSDVNRTTLKPVYELTGVPPYNNPYTQLSNPLTLSSTGTIVDAEGNEVVLYYYPFDQFGNVELYYVTVYSAGGVLQFTRQAWPNFDESGFSSSDVTNYIPNGQFLLHNNQPAYNGITGSTYALGQIRALDTFIAAGNWSFDRSSNTSIDFVLFNPFGSYVANPTSSPRYFCEIICTVPHAGDTLKDLRINFPDVNKFSSTTQEYTFACTAQSNSGSVLNNVQLILRKYFGAGGSATTETVLETFSIPIIYTVQQQSFTFGINSGKTIGTGGDDVVSLILRFPPTSTFHVSLTNFVLTPNAVSVTTFPTTTEAQFMSVALTSVPPPDPNGFDMYCPLVQTPQGLKFSRSDIGMVYPSIQIGTPITGSLLCDGTTYEMQAYSSDSIPYARLGSIIFPNSYVNSPLYGTGLNYVTAVAGLATSPIQFFLSTNNANAVTNSADGSVPTNFGISTIVTGINNFGFTAYPASTPNNSTPYVLVIQNTFYQSVTNPSAGTSGFNILYYGNDAGLPLSYQVFSIFPNFSSISTLAGTYFTFSLAAASPVPYYVWFQVNGSGADPAPGGTGIKINLNSNFTYIDVVNAISYALSGNQVTLFANFIAGASITPGSYFTFNTSTSAYYVWYQVNGVGADPAPPNRFPIPINVLNTYTAIQVRDNTGFAINSKFFAVPDIRGAIIKGAAGSSMGSAEDDATRRYTLFKQPDPGGTGSATFQLDSNASHYHTATSTLSPALPIIADVSSSGTATGTSGSDWALRTYTVATTIANAGALRSNPYNVAMFYYIKY